MQGNAEGTTRVVEIEIDVKSWLQTLPTAAELRPVCPMCGAPGVDVNGKVLLHGHGVRGRQCWGPAEPGTAGVCWKLPQRRYACQRCTAVIVVRPRGMMRWRRYTAAAIALALWLWSVEAQTDARVRKSIGVHPTAGFSRPERWTTLRRWAAAARDGRLWRCVVGDAGWTLRECAERAAHIVATFADPSLEPAARAFAGAMHAP